jgi:hypothetical protein
MKKFLLILTVTVVALCLAAPAMAELKLTTKGYMDVTGININNNIIDRGIGAGNTNDSAASWYQMEMVVDTVLHINDKVRIFGQFTVMERGWGGNSVGTNEDGGAFGNAALNQNYRGAHNFWWERLYLSFPLFGGTLYVGRMGGGGWAYPYQDAEDNRDRIKYVRKFGHITVLGVIEQLAEADGAVNGLNALTIAPAGGDPFDTSHGDVDSYAVGAVIPFSKNILYRPLFYYIDRQNTAAAAGFGGADGYTGIFMQGLMIKAGPFKMDAEVNYRWTDRKNVFQNPGPDRILGTIDDLGAEDWDEGQWSYWIDAGVTFGPAEIALGTFFLEGTDERFNRWENRSLWGIGAEFQPLLLLTSEDCGLLWNSAGVPNGSVGLSGFEAYYLRAGYKISDSMKLTAILGYMEADEMLAGSHWDGVRSADDEIGWEFDIGFEWKFMPNIKYVAEFAYLATGDYFDTFNFAGNGVGTDVSNDVWGMRHMLVINW